MFQKGPGKTKVSHQRKAEMELLGKRTLRRKIFGLLMPILMSVNDSNDSDENQIVYK